MIFVYNDENRRFFSRRESNELIKWLEYDLI